MGMGYIVIDKDPYNTTLLMKTVASAKQEYLK
jgi:hypothetical protein